MDGNLAIDVGLLAAMLGLYFTKKDDKVIIILMVILISHMFITKDDHLYEYEEPEVEILNEINIVDDSFDEDENLGATVDGFSAEDVSTRVEPATSNTPGISEAVSLKQRASTVSNGVFGRQLSTPQTNLTSSIFPKTSLEANGKLADSRGSFFKSLVS